MLIVKPLLSNNSAQLVCWAVDNYKVTASTLSLMSFGIHPKFYQGTQEVCPHFHGHLCRCFHVRMFTIIASWLPIDYSVFCCLCVMHLCYLTLIFNYRQNEDVTGKNRLVLQYIPLTLLIIFFFSVFYFFLPCFFSFLGGNLWYTRNIMCDWTSQQYILYALSNACRFVTSPLESNSCQLYLTH